MATLICGPVLFRPIELKQKGSRIIGHEHYFDHVFYCIKGAFFIKSSDGGEYTLGPGGFINIEARLWHELTALEDDSFGHCIFTHRAETGEVVQHYAGYDLASMAHRPSGFMKIQPPAHEAE